MLTPAEKLTARRHGRLRDGFRVRGLGVLGLGVLGLGVLGLGVRVLGFRVLSCFRVLGFGRFFLSCEVSVCSAAVISFRFWLRV